MANPEPEPEGLHRSLKPVLWVTLFVVAVTPFLSTGVLQRSVSSILVAGMAIDPEIARITDEFWSTRFERMSVVVERGVERGEADPGVDAALVIEVVVAAVWFRCVVARSEVDDDLVAAAVDAAMTLVAPGPASPAR